MKKEILECWFNGKEKQTVEYFTDDFKVDRKYNCFGEIIEESFRWKDKLHGITRKSAKNSFEIHIRGYIGYKREDDYESFYKKDSFIVKYKNKVLYSYKKKNKQWFAESYLNLFPERIDRYFCDFIKEKKLTCNAIVYFDNGSIFQQNYYKMGTLKEVKEFHKNGQLHSFEQYKKRALVDGEYNYYKEDGIVYKHFTIQKGRYSGRYFINEGLLKEELIYKDGEIIEGYVEESYSKTKTTKYYKNGNLERVVDEIDNKKELTYYINKTTIKELYVDGKLINKEYLSDFYSTFKSAIKIYKYPELDKEICKNCCNKELHEIFDNGMNICPHNFKDLKNNCKYYLEQVSSLTMETTIL